MASEEAQELPQDHELPAELAEEEEEEEEFVIMEQLDEETQNLAAGLASRHSDELIHALQEMLKVLAVPKRGGRVLRQYVLASPKCAELLSAWDLGSGAPSAVPLMLVLAELFRHPGGKGVGVRARGGDIVARQKAKALVVVQSRLEKLARTIGRLKIKDIYSHLSSKQRNRQKAALKLLSSIVLRGKLLAVDVATNFDFTLEALKKLAQHPFKAPVSNSSEGSLHQSTRFFFIEFALSFLVVGDPGLLRWILQKRPLYAGILHGLARDGEATIIQVLRVFQEKVMAPASLVPAGLQSAVFGDVALDQLARIAGDELFGESADVAYETLISLCTDPSHGLCPEYASPWESVNIKSGAHGGNQGRLLRLLLRLRVTEAFRHKELFLATARIRPRLAAAYLDAVPYSLEPRPSPTWFTIMSLVADLIHISSSPPPFASMALRDLPVPAADGPVVRNNLRHLLPRALTKVALNRGLQHANMLVKHASLRLLLESLLSLEKLFDGAYAAAESTGSQSKPGSSYNTTEAIADTGLTSDWSGENTGKGTLMTANRSANRDEDLRAQEQESKRRQWLGLVECIQDTMRATLPDPNVLLLINSSISTRNGGSLKEPDGSHKRTQAVVEGRAGKRRKKNVGFAVDEGVGEHEDDTTSGTDSEEDEEEENSSALQSLAQIWGSEAIASAAGVNQSLLHAKVLEVLAAYQRVLPVAFADKSFDPFKLLPSDPMALSLAQQKAFLSLLLATTAPLQNVSQRNQPTYRPVEAGGSGYMYKHLKPLLKLMLGSSVGYIREDTHLLASRIMVSTDAFESNTWESNLWLDHLSRLEGNLTFTGCRSDDSQGENLSQHVLGSIGECIVGFLAEAVGSVGRTLYKYFDLLFSLLSVHSLGEASTEHSNGFSGLVALEFGPFVVCALEHALRVVRSDSKSLTQSQQSAITLYVAGVLTDLLRMQTDPRALGIVITSLLSPELHRTSENPDNDISTLGSEWTPLQALYQQANSFISGEVIVPTPTTQVPNLMINGFSGQLPDVIGACREAVEDGFLRERLVSTLVCAPLEEIRKNFFQILEVVSKMCGQSTPLLITLCGLHSGLLAEVDPDFENVKKPNDHAIGRRALVEDLLSAFSSRSLRLDVSALSSSSSSLRSQAHFIYSFLQSLPFSVLFPAIMHGSEGKALTFELLAAALNNSFSSILARDQLRIMQMILSYIQQLASASIESSERKQRLDMSFAYLKRLVVIPKNMNSGGGHGTGLQEIILCEDMVKKSLAHPVVAVFCLSPTAMEASSAKHGKCARLLDEYIVDYLKFLLESCSAIDLHGKPVAELLGSLRETSFQACKPFVQRAMKLFLLKLGGRASDEDEIAFSRDFQLIQSFILQLASYADPQHYLSFLSDLASRKNGKTPSGVSPSSVFLEFSRIFFETWSQVGKKDGCNTKSSGPLLQKTLIDVFKHVVHEVLKDASEDGDGCLLAALLASTSASVGGCSSTSSQFSLLVSVTPIGVMKYCIQHPTAVRGSIAKILARTSSTHRAEFGRLLCKGTGGDKAEKDDMPLKTARIFLDETKLQTGNINFSLSDDDLLLLLPAAKLFVCKDHSRSVTSVVAHVGWTYLRLLTTHVKRWDEFISKLVDHNELRLDVTKLRKGTLRVEELTGSHFNDLLVLMKRCLSICPSSCKKRVSLVRKLLRKVGLPFSDIQIDSFQGTQADLSRLFVQIYGRASVARQILSAIESQAPEESNAEMSILKQQKLRSSMVETVLRFATGLASTSTVIYKLAAQLKKQSISSCDPGAFEVVKVLEGYLQLQLLEVVESLDTNGAEADIISLFERHAKTCLRYAFGKVEGIRVLRALAMRLANLSNEFTARRKEAASFVLELVLSHSQFVTYIVSCSAALRPLPTNLGRQAGKGTVLNSLPSILSLIGSPLGASGEQNSGGTADMEVRSVSGVENLELDNGSDALAEVPEASQLALLELVRSVFQLKMHPHGGVLSTEDKATVEELLSLLLAAYGATTNRVDSEIYALMCELDFYGGTGSPGLAGMDYLWGEAALKRRKEKLEERSQSIDEEMDTDENLLEVRKRTFKEDLALDPRRCGLSVLCFPTLAQHAISLGVPELGVKPKKVFQGDTYDAEENHLRVAAYDPRYILQFSLHGLSEGCIDTEEFVCLGFLAVAITSLSSSEEGTRKLGYKILAKYMTSLEEGSKFKGQPQIRMLLNYVRNAVTEEWQQLPYVLMLFAAETSCILMHPENAHFMTITRYLLKGPALDLEYVPLFHSMFGSGSPRYRSERLWMLRLLACGLTSSRDSRVFRRQFVLEILMSFYGSPLADSFTRIWVLQVFIKASKIRGCVQPLLERSGFLLWLASTAVNYMDLSTSEQDRKEAGDLPVMVFEIIERLLRWKFLEQRCLREGMAELTTAALTLRHFLTHCSTTPNQRAIFRRPTIRIMTYVLRLSQRRKKHETHFSLSMYDIAEAIHWVESDGPGSGSGVQTAAETRALALQMFLQSSPPAASTFEDKQLLCMIASWAVPVAIQALAMVEHKQVTSEHAENLAERLPEKLTRWLTASLVLGKLTSSRSKLGSTKYLADFHPTCLNTLYDSQSIHSADFHPANMELAIHLLQLQIHIVEEGSSTMVMALASLWPFYKPEEILPGHESGELVNLLLERILNHISAPQEADYAWRWSFNNAWRKKETPANANMYIEISSFEAEMRQIALTVFQQLVLEQQSSGLARLVSHWAKGLSVSPSSSSHFIAELEHNIEELRRTCTASQ